MERVIVRIMVRRQKGPSGRVMGQGADKGKEAGTRSNGVGSRVNNKQS